MRAAWWATLALTLGWACHNDGDGDDDDDTDVADTDDTDDTDTTPPEWTVLGDSSNLPAASLLSIWMSSTDDVFIVGADDGTGPVVLHYDGTAWSRLATGTTGDLWWVWSAPGSDLVWVSGAGGRMLTYARSTGAWSEEVITNPGYKLFGTWGTSDTNIWSVGGDTDFGALDGMILHYDGVAWTEFATSPPDDVYTKTSTFKVWGAAHDDVWVVGTRALLMHWDGAAWTTFPDPVAGTSTLTTVHGSGPNWVVAVGGPSNLRAAVYDGTTWTDRTPQPALGEPIVPNINGVYSPEPNRAVVCGDSGSIWWLDGTTWAPDEHAAAPAGDFHACWVDEDGAVWAVGGDLTSRDQGLILYGGTAVPTIAL
jgi:hypothetical protein